MKGSCSHHVPYIEEHDVVLIQVFLVEVCDLGGQEAARLVGALEEPRGEAAQAVLESMEAESTITSPLRPILLFLSCSFCFFFGGFNH